MKAKKTQLTRTQQNIIGWLGIYTCGSLFVLSIGIFLEYNIQVLYHQAVKTWQIAEIVQGTHPDIAAQLSISDFVKSKIQACKLEPMAGICLKIAQEEMSVWAKNSTLIASCVLTMSGVSLLLFKSEVCFVIRGVSKRFGSRFLTRRTPND